MTEILEALGNYEREDVLDALTELQDTYGCVVTAGAEDKTHDCIVEVEPAMFDIDEIRYTEILVEGEYKGVDLNTAVFEKANGNRFNICVSGEIGAGSTSLAKELSKRLGIGYRAIASETLRRLAKEAGTDITSFYAREGASDLDVLLDAELAKVLTEGESSVHDSRLAWHFAERHSSLSIHVVCDKDTRVDRLCNRLSEPCEKVRRDLDMRAATESNRYDALYGVDNSDLGNYNCVVDTTGKSVDQCVMESLYFILQFTRNMCIFAPTETTEEV